MEKKPLKQTKTNQTKKEVGQETGPKSVAISKQRTVGFLRNLLNAGWNPAETVTRSKKIRKPLQVKAVKNSLTSLIHITWILSTFMKWQLFSYGCSEVSVYLQLGRFSVQH